MKNIKYKVNRDNVHIGTVIKARYVDKVDADEAKILHVPEGSLVPDGYTEIRPSVLFVPDENKRMNDLLFNSPAYRVLNITEDIEKDNVIVTAPDEILVSYPYNISDLLAYLGYREELTYGDILKIRNIIFSSDFYAQFCELFGFRETYSTEVQYYEKGELVEDPKEIEKKMREFDKRRKMGEIGFGGVYNSPLDSRYFDIIHDHSDGKETICTLGSLSIVKTRDAFAPNRKEEPSVKKLSLTN